MYSKTDQHLDDIYIAIDRAIYTGQISEELAEHLEDREIQRCLGCLAIEKDSPDYPELPLTPT